MKEKKEKEEDSVEEKEEKIEKKDGKDLVDAPVVMTSLYSAIELMLRKNKSKDIAEYATVMNSRDFLRLCVCVCVSV